MRIHKRKVAMIGIAVVMIASLAGCGASEGSDKNNVTPGAESVAASGQAVSDDDMEVTYFKSDRAWYYNKAGAKFYTVINTEDAFECGNGRLTDLLFYEYGGKEGEEPDDSVIVGLRGVGPEMSVSLTSDTKYNIYNGKYGSDGLELLSRVTSKQFRRYVKKELKIRDRATQIIT